MIDDAAMFLRLTEACRMAGGQARFAEAHGLSLGYVNDVLHARKPAGPSVLAAIGLRRVSRYVETRKTNATPHTESPAP